MSRSAEALGAVVEVAGACGHDTSGARVRRVGTSVLVDLPAAGVLARLDDAAGGARARRQVVISRAMNAAGVPAVRLVEPADQPLGVRVGGHPASVTLWHCEQLTGDPVGAAEVGRLARALHDAEAPAGLPRLAPLEAVAEQIETARIRGASGVGIDVLVTVHERLVNRWGDFADLRSGIVHGDLHVGNVLATPEGPVLGDLELAGVGPVAYDLVPQTVAVSRYGAPEGDLAAFEAAYGEPLPAEARSGPLVEIYELWLTAWAVANRHLDAEHATEAARRLARWEGGGPGVSWRIL